MCVRLFGFLCISIGERFLCALCMPLSRVNHMRERECVCLCICACMQSLAAIAFLWRDKPLFLSVAVVTAINAYRTTNIHTVLYVL